MLMFIARRLATGAALILIVTAITFAMVFANGTNIAVNILGETATPEDIAATTTQLGLDRPVFVQYFDWLGSALTGDLGTSYFTEESVWSALAVRVPVTVSLVLFAMVLILAASIVAGVVAARRGGAIDSAVQSLSVIGFALPSYWIALVLVLVVAIPLPAVFPPTGFVSIGDSVVGWLGTATLPALALAIGGIGAVAQQIRGSMVDVLRLDYIRTLRSRGISDRSIFYRHALRNAAGPALTVLSLQFIGMLGGVIIIERVFALPGIGILASTSALRGDVPVVMGTVAFTVVVVVVVNLLVDILQGVLNPKVRIDV
ncbi:ABC transporter permease [Rhodococcus pseudokoreensis]|uniref:ABC transporter permease n=1 Tax=Rhodococcus pseudokoreensis TaxID=2811421 RepID=A0A974W225_9NOCA|nr:ABC transporter permease [Rhodococcus pseudokoreensis]QSE89813.1 ABC transporter permease [Rhodococcus pseudokoreensis]